MWSKYGEFARELGRDVDKDELLKSSGKMCRRGPMSAAEAA